MDIRFDPFSVTRITDLTATHLGALREVSEGWYIEYKSEIPSARSIAKSISAFANHFGGWLFYGVRERDLKAAGFPGVENPDAQLSVIRNAAAHQVSPVPYFETHVIAGPSVELGLPAGRSIIVVFVPSGMDAPYIHASGIVYRRVDAQSEPVAERDRSVLDELWAERGEHAQRLERLLNEPPSFAVGYPNRPIIRFMIASDLTGDLRHRAEIPFEHFVERMRDSRMMAGAYLPFDVFSSASDAWIARQNGVDPMDAKTLSWSRQIPIPQRVHRSISLCRV
jgi:hypothetical protein